MKYWIYALLVLIASCREGVKKNLVLSTDSLPSQQFQVNVERDTTLRTAGGALLKIPKNAIASDSGSVILEIKEAFTISQMIRAGLVTESNGQPLSSGGMIYINGTGGRELRISHPISVAIPADFVRDSMQLYKGEVKDGTINWTDPKPLKENPLTKFIAMGQQLFRQTCGNCHAMGRVLTAPDLAHFPRRFPDGELTARVWSHTLGQQPGDTTFSEHQASPWYHPDLYTCNLIKMFGYVGPSFSLKEEEWQAIYTYIQNESDRRSLPLPSHAYLKDCVDSCQLYTEAIGDLRQLRQMSEEKRKRLLADTTNPMVKKNEPAQLPQQPVGAASPGSSFEETVIPKTYGAQYYQFTIESTGWFNIDILLKDIPGIEPSELLVRIQGTYRERINIYLIIPSLKANVEGGPTGKTDEFAFLEKNGSIPLPQGAKAFILAITESEGSFAYQLMDFIAGKQQSFTLELKTSTREEFEKAMAIFEGEGLKIGVQDAANSIQLRAEDANIKNLDQKIKQAEMLKPKNCDCDCKEQAGTGTAADEIYLSERSDTTIWTNR
jgi:hypothetical protein